MIVEFTSLNPNEKQRENRNLTKRVEELEFYQNSYQELQSVHENLKVELAKSQKQLRTNESNPKLDQLVDLVWQETQFNSTFRNNSVSLESNSEDEENSQSKLEELNLKNKFLKEEITKIQKRFSEEVNKKKKSEEKYQILIKKVEILDDNEKEINSLKETVFHKNKEIELLHKQVKELDLALQFAVQKDSRNTNKKVEDPLQILNPHLLWIIFVFGIIAGLFFLGTGRK